MTLTDPYPILPFTQPACGSITLPGSKSITNRAMILAALSKGQVILENALFSEDTLVMVEALQKLGFTVEAEEAQKRIVVEGKGGRIPKKKASLFVGNAGTAARFLTAFCASANSGRYEIDGDPQMRFRPMKGLLQCLQTQGARITSNNDCFPIEIQANGLRGGDISMDASASSQFISAVLMLAPYGQRNLRLHLKGETVSKPFINMTLSMMNQFGQPLFGCSKDGVYEVSSGNGYDGPLGGVFQIEGDATAASYFLTLPHLVGGEVVIPGLRFSGLQGDVDYNKVLLQMGSKVIPESHGMVAKVSDTSSSRKAVSYDFSDISDTFLTLAAVAPLLNGTTRIEGIEHTRRQETDRVKAMALELKRLGIEVTEEAGVLTIIGNPKKLKADTTILTHKDHRFAMSFAILGCYDLKGDGTPWLFIKDPGCCAKTFPNFFEVLEKLHGDSHK
ncbi:MAG: 3-phosphoshikimate 1-carboxyvinyltransferase [Opitutales bacterium]|nr:3-phosphoshikimate 1-carboxyvinyltransferase [Opitutales bacterium]MCH8539534.1 3-phosphoshikimate 1-carboxyvinyltransferase [Opitutales bacterium]